MKLYMAVIGNESKELMDILYKLHDLTTTELAAITAEAILTAAAKEDSEPSYMVEGISHIMEITDMDLEYLREVDKENRNDSN